MDVSLIKDSKSRELSTKQEALKLKQSNEIGFTEESRFDVTIKEEPLTEKIFTETYPVNQFNCPLNIKEESDQEDAESNRLTIIEQNGESENEPSHVSDKPATISPTVSNFISIKEEQLWGIRTDVSINGDLIQMDKLVTICASVLKEEQKQSEKAQSCQDSFSMRDSIPLCVDGIGDNVLITDQKKTFDDGNVGSEQNYLDDLHSHSLKTSDFRHTSANASYKERVKGISCIYSNCKFSVDSKEVILQHPENKMYKCDLCKFSSNRRQSLLSHLKNHAADKPFKCHICKYSTAKNRNLRDHAKKHTRSKTFKCSLCPYSFRKNFELVRHFRTHCIERAFKCQFCDYSANKKSSLERHVALHSPNFKGKVYVCDICQFRTTHKNYLSRHASVHLKVKDVYRCHLCEFGTREESVLSKHIQTHCD